MTILKFSKLVSYRWGAGTATSDASSLLNFSLRSQVSSCGEQRQELVGEALAALLEVDDEGNGDGRMVVKIKETFGAACLPLPGELRYVFWEEEFIGRQSRRRGRSREELWQDWVEKQQKPSSDMVEMARVWVASRGHTLLWVYRQLIAMPYIALARQAWIYRDISVTISRLRS